MQWRLPLTIVVVAGFLSVDSWKQISETVTKLSDDFMNMLEMGSRFKKCRVRDLLPQLCSTILEKERFFYSPQGV